MKSDSSLEPLVGFDMHSSIAALTDLPDDTKIPTTWQLAKVDDLVFRIEAGKNVRCIEKPPASGQKGIVKISAVTWGEFLEDESKTLDKTHNFNISWQIKPGDFLISRANTLELVGACVIVRSVNRTLMLSDKVLRIHMPDKWKNWLLLFLRSSLGRFQIENLATGNQLSMRNISQESLRRIVVPIPPLAEQKRIVKKVGRVLWHVNAAQERLAHVPVILKRFRQAVLAAGCSGKLTEDWRDNHSDRHLAEELFLDIEKARQAIYLSKGDVGKREGCVSRLKPENLYINRLKGFGGVPVTWSWTDLISVASTNRFSIVDGPFGSDLKLTDYDVAGEVPVLTIAMMYDMRRALKARCITRAKFEQVKRSMVKGGDILVAKIGNTYGLTSLYPLDYPIAIIPANMCKITPDNALIATNYLKFWLESPIFRRYLDEIVAASAQPAFSVRNFKKLPIPMPPLEEQREIVNRAEALFKLADTIEERVASASVRADKLAKSILGKAFRGELVPTEAELARREGRDYELASVLLERIKRERGSAASAGSTLDTRRRRRRTASASAS